MKRIMFVLLAVFLGFGILAPGATTTALACSAECSAGTCVSGPCTGIASCKCTKDGRPKCKCYGKNSLSLTSSLDLDKII